MNKHQDNPCMACSTDQDCCTRLSGLTLTKDEFERYFREHSEQLLTTGSDNFFIVSTKEGRACPNWKDGGCRIYLERPIDCRLFPYSISQITRRRKKVEVEFHGRSHCPQQDRLLMPESEARALIMKFCRIVFGENKTVMIYEKTRWETPRLRRWIDAVIARLQRFY